MKCQLDDCLEVGMVDHQFLVYENPLGIRQQQNKTVPLESIQFLINFDNQNKYLICLTRSKSYPTGIWYNITIPMRRCQQNNGGSYTYASNENTY